MRKARIISTGSYLPQKVLSNGDLEKMVETSDEWIVSRTGISERRIARDDEYTSDMGLEAAKRALADINMDPKEIDFILVATITPDYMFPSTACLLQSQLGAVNAAAVDFQAACSGFIYGLATAKAFIESGMYRNVLVVAAEKLSSIIDYTDRTTCILFGDGASACVVSDKGKGLYVGNVCMGADGTLCDAIIMPGGGCKNPTTSETVAGKQHYIKMKGNEVFKHAVRRMESAINDCLERSGISEAQIGKIIPHQANIRIIEALSKRFDLAEGKVIVTLNKYGNTSASSVGIALDELLKDQKPAIGENLILVAFGAGLTWGATALTYGEADE